MKKIMFNDKYGLTQAVLEGRKTITRRLIRTPRTMEGKDVYGFAIATYRTGEVAEVMAVDEDGAMINNILPNYKPGEVVAVAQSYGAILDELENPLNFSCMDHWESKSGDRGKYAELAMYSPGGNNKMFVSPYLMPHRIHITNVRVERLQDISDGDCVREGVVGFTCNLYEYRGICYSFPGDKNKMGTYLTPREAFAALIDKISGKGTWESNPWVFVYEFENVR